MRDLYKTIDTPLRGFSSATEISIFLFSFGFLSLSLFLSLRPLAARQVIRPHVLHRDSREQTHCRTPPIDDSIQ